VCRVVMNAPRRARRHFTTRRACVYASKFKIRDGVVHGASRVCSVAGVATAVNEKRRRGVRFGGTPCGNPRDFSMLLFHAGQPPWSRTIGKGKTDVINLCAMKSVVVQCNSHWLTGNGACSTGASCCAGDRRNINDLASATRPGARVRIHPTRSSPISAGSFRRVTG
jgi:hypothetical protein